MSVSVWDDPSLSVCLAYVIMRFPCTSAGDSINIYIALNVVIQSWQIYCIRMKTEFLMNSIWSPSGNSIYTLIFFTPFLWLLCDMVWIYFIFLIPFLSLCNLYLNTSLVLTFFLVGCFGVNKKWLTTNAFLWKCRKQLKTLTSSNEGLKTNYVSRRVQTHLRFLKSDWSIKSYWERKAIYQSIHPFIIMYIRKRRLNRVNPLGYYYTYSKHKKLKATTFLLLSSDI